MYQRIGRQCIVLVYKGKGNIRECANYRGIRYMGGYLLLEWWKALKNRKRKSREGLGLVEDV